MKPISEEEARRVLAEAKDLSVSPEAYQAEREELGWVFRWADQSMRWVGGRPWAVTDSRKVGMMRLGEIPEKTLERLERG